MSHGHWQHAQNIGKVRPHGFRDMQADRETDRPTNRLITIQLQWGEVIK